MAMNNYTDWSDFEVNKAVAEAIGFSVICYHSVVMVSAGEGREHIEFDPCNNPSDAFPIIVENGIGFKQNFSNDDWVISPRNYDDAHLTQVGDRPLRAAMICFLMMKDAGDE